MENNMEKECTSLSKASRSTENGKTEKDTAGLEGTAANDVLATRLKYIF